MSCHDIRVYLSVSPQKETANLVFVRPTRKCVRDNETVKRVKGNFDEEFALVSGSFIFASQLAVAKKC